jgi:putative membrane-bound dehydrogenase-like protein
MAHKQYLFFFLFISIISPAIADKTSDILFEDFESGTYEKWTIKGNAFGQVPIKTSEVPKHQGNMKAKGKYLVNSHASTNSDTVTGSLTSKTFTINRKYINLLINGGNHAGKTCVNLVIDGKTISSLTGSNSNLMQQRVFDTSKFMDKEAQIHVIDNHTGSWGNIGLDHIVFSNKKAKVVTKPKPRRGKKTQSARTGAFSPAEQLSKFSLPEGFVIELVASEEHGIINPIDLTFDDAGRLWTQTASMYPLDPGKDISWNNLLKLMDNPAAQKKDPEFQRILSLYEGRTRGKDKVLIIENPQAKPQKAKIFADGLAIPQSILPYKNGVYIAHGSELIFLNDSDNDGKADQREAILKGFGYTDTHTMSHSLARGPGGWIHFSQGALNKGLVYCTKSGAQTRIDFSKIARFSIDGKKINLVNSGLNNIWGFQLRGNGQWYGSEANDMGFSAAPMEPQSGYGGIGGQKLRRYQPMMPSIHKFRVGASGISSMAFADDTSGSFPEEWRDVAFLANPITNKINAVKVIRNADGTVTSKHLPDLLSTEDDWFRPVNIEFGPDGCLYIADWYNKIISHNEVRRTHPDRDRTHGRIWRIRHKSQKPRPSINFYKLTTKELPQYLKSPSLWAKRAAWHQIADRKATELAPQLKAMLRDTSLDVTTRILTLWALEGSGSYDEKLISELLQSTDDELRRETVRALSQSPVSTSKLAALLKPLLNDKNVMVRSQVLRTLNDYGRADAQIIDLLVSFCRPALKGNSLGGSYERNFERFLARRALELYPAELKSYLDSKAASQQPSSHILWASQALSAKNRSLTFLKLWDTIKDQKINEPNFIILAHQLKDPNIYKIVQPTFNKKDKAENLVKLANKNYTAVQSTQLASIITPAIKQLLNNKTTIELALDTILKLNIPKLEDAVRSVTKSTDTPVNQTKLALLIFSKNAEKHKDIFHSISLAKNAAFELKIISINALSKIEPKLAQKVTNTLLPSLNKDQKSKLFNKLASSPQGTLILLSLIDSKLATYDDFDLSSAERMANSLKKDSRAQKLLANRQQKRIDEQKAFKKKLHHLMALANKKSGDASMGKKTFTAMCLACHSVGKEGAGFAPPLDGSAHRENEGLLTAILNPDAAVEGNYVLFRVIKKDGSSVEGYCEKRDHEGTTMRFMGGGKLYIPANEITSQNFVGKRSVMPSMFGGFDDKTMADLLAYIRTLK